VTRVVFETGQVVNPNTASGTILVAGPSGNVPVWAATYGEWALDIDDERKARGAAFLPLPLCNYLLQVCPKRAQSFYDAILERHVFPSKGAPISTALLSRIVTSPLAPAVLFTMDFLIATTFLYWAVLHAAIWICGTSLFSSLVAFTVAVCGAAVLSQRSSDNQRRALDSR